MSDRFVDDSPIQLTDIPGVILLQPGWPEPALVADGYKRDTHGRFAATFSPAEKKLRSAIEEGGISEGFALGNSSGDSVRMGALANDTMVVVRDPGTTVFGSTESHLVDDSMNHFFADMGVTAPVSVIHDGKEVMTFVDGRPGHEVVSSGRSDVLLGVLLSPSGRRVAMADYLSGNRDRNDTNWFEHDGQAVPIDNGEVFRSSRMAKPPEYETPEDVLASIRKDGWEAAVRSNRFFQANRDIPFTPKEIAATRAALDSSLPRFRHNGQEDLWKLMDRRLGEISDDGGVMRLYEEVPM